MFHNKLWKILKETEVLDHFTCLLRNPYVGVDKEPEELWMEVCNTVHKVYPNHPQEKEMQEGKWLSEEALQMVEKKKILLVQFSRSVVSNSS